MMVRMSDMGDEFAGEDKSGSVPSTAASSYASGTSSNALFGVVCEESKIDEYASKVLESSSPSGAFIDANLGPYVTSRLRCNSPDEDVTQLEEFESLMELLQEQCGIQRDTALRALKDIASAVSTSTVPYDFLGGPYEQSPSYFHYPGELPDYSLNAQANSERLSYVANNGGAMSLVSPLKPDNLIPVDLLGALDNPVEHSYSVDNQDEYSPSEYPPLGAQTAEKSKKGTKVGKKYQGTNGSYATQEASQDLASALFHPASFRHSSTDDKDSNYSNNVNQHHPPEVDLYFQQQVELAVEMLLSMNADLSEDAASQAAIMANGDVNVAQYLIDCVLQAPPVCRHLLNNGCYRSDCQFSHDIEGHTCVFWLRGRCGKEGTCRFLHGFNEALLEGINQEFTTGEQDVKDSYADPFFTSQLGGGGAKCTLSSSFHGATQDSFLAGARLGPPSWEHSQSLGGMNSFSSSSLEMQRQAVEATSSFANIASKGYNHQTCFQASSALSATFSQGKSASITSLKIPQDVWNPHERRDPSAFRISDPMDRYREVSSKGKRLDVIDLHFQSTKTFSTVLACELAEKLRKHSEVWIVTGTGHHVGSKTHQKGGGVLETAVMSWLSEKGYKFLKGKDRNGHGGALLVKR